MTDFSWISITCCDCCLGGCLTLFFHTSHSYISLVLIDMGERRGDAFFSFLFGAIFLAGTFEAYVCSFLLQFWFYFMCCKKLFLFTNFL